MPHVHQPIALIGLSGSGKSTVARALAVRLGWPVRDTDPLVEAMTGRTIPAIFAAEGEPAFRALEADALCAALDDAPAVIATGGGIVVRASNRVLLRERALVVWLDAPTEALVARLLAHDESRPLLAGDDPAARLETLRAARASLYAEVAHLTVLTADRTLDAICDEIVQAMALRVVPPVSERHTL